MKKSISVFTFFFVMVLSLFSFESAAADVTSTFKVNESCGMCKKKIETALRIKGVKKVNWDKETHLLTITFNSSNISLDEIHQRIAAVGYDTDKIKANDEAYAKLDECCKYEREQ